MFIRLSTLLLKIITGLLCLLAILLATSLGAKIVLLGVNQLPFLTIEHKQGAMLDELALTRVNVTLGSLVIDVSNVTLVLKKSCLLKGHICLNKIAGEQLNLTLSTNGHSETTPPKQKTSELINIPLTLDLQNILFNDIELNINDLYIKVLNFSGNVYLADELIDVSTPQADYVQVKIPNSEPEHHVSLATSPNYLSATSTKKLPTVSIPLDLRVQQLDVKKIDIDILKFQESFATIALSAQWKKHHVVISQAALTANHYGDISTAGHLELIHPYPLLLSGQSKLTYQGVPATIANNHYQYHFSGSMEQLSAKLSSQGEIISDHQLEIDLTSNNLPFNLQSHIQSIPVSQLLQQNLEIQAVDLSAHGDINQQQFKATLQGRADNYLASKLSLNGQHTYTKATQIAPASYALNVNQLAFFDNTTQSDLNLSAKLAFQEKLTWQLIAESKHLRLPKSLATVLPSVIPAITGELSGNFSSQGHFAFTKNPSWQIGLSNANVSGQLNQHPFTLLGGIELSHLPEETFKHKRATGQDESAGGYHLDISPPFIINHSNLLLTALESEFSLTGNVVDNWQLSGQLINHNLGNLLEGAAGEHQLNFEFSQNRQQPKLTFNAQAKNLRFNEHNIANIDYQGSYQPAKDHQGSISVSANNLSTGTINIDTLSVNFAGDLFKQTSRLLFKGDVSGELNSESNWQHNTQQLNAKLYQSHLSWQALTWQLKDSVNLAYQHHATNGASLKIKAHCWQNEALNACLDKHATISQAGDLALSFESDLALLTKHFDMENIKIKNTVTGIINTSWQQNQRPTIDSTINFSPGEIAFEQIDKPAFIATRWQKGHLKIALTDDVLNSSLLVYNQNNQPFIDFSSQLNLLGDKQLSASINTMHFDLSPLKPLFSEVNNFSAKLNSNINVSGSLYHPQLQGKLSINDGLADFQRSANQLKDFNTAITFNGQQAKLEGHFNIDDDKAYLDGHANWSNEANATLTIHAKQLNLSVPQRLDISLVPKVSLTYEKNALSVLGDIHILTGLLQLEELPEGAISQSPDAVIVDASGKSVKKADKLAIESNINITIDDAFALEGHGFKGNLGGELKVRQAKYQPLKVFGSLNVNNGFYKAYGQHLNVERGKVTFNGSVDKPYVDFRASRHIRSDDVNVGISLNGLLDSAELKLYSDPTMEQPEILSYLVRGSSLSSNSSNAAAIGIALSTTLNHTSNLTKLVEEIPLLRDVTLDSEVDGDQAQATISGYIGERIYLKYGIGIYEPVDEVTVRFYMLNSLWLETVSGIEKSADIYYSFDIE